MVEGRWFYNPHEIIRAQLTKIKEAGYRKITGEPPVLSDTEIYKIKDLKYSPDMDEAELFMVALRGVAKAQVDLCVRFYESQ